MSYFEKAFAAADKSKTLILEAERTIWKTPETGYRETKTSAYLAGQFEKLGYTLTYAGDIPGFYTVLDTGRQGPKVLVFGELDSLVCADHPECDRETKAVHACGHNAQCAALLGIAAALREPGVTDSLCGSIMLCAVPAEELIEVEYREELRKKGIIRFFGGKPEFLARGYFDDVDVALMVHTTTEDIDMSVAGSCVGCLLKKITYKGVASHAGGAPQLGINALYAANLGLSAINSLRETFVEQDYIRVHPIITNGGQAVNAIPDTASIESFVRGASVEAIRRENKKINRALRGAAVSMGANIEICDRSGYAPLNLFSEGNGLALEACKLVSPDSCRMITKMGTGSTDLGDISTVIPTMYIYAGGAVGMAHGKNYYISDPYRACVNAAKVQLALLGLLLENGGENAERIKKAFKPVYASIAEYIRESDAANCDLPPIVYNDDGTVVL